MLGDERLKAMIMAAGVGSRLMPMTIDIPKPMIPMANRPLMADTVQLLREHSFTNIIANLHHHADCISNYFGDGRAYGVALEYSREEELLGTAGGVKRCAWFLDDCFIIVSGDALTDMNLTALVRAHKRHGALATIALKEVQDVENFGIVITDEKGRIQSFQEKPRAREALSRVANTGIYVFEPEIFQYIPVGQFYDFGKQVFPQLVKIGAPFYGEIVEDYWCDVGNITTYRQAHADVLEGKVKVNMEGNITVLESGNRVLLGYGAKMGKNIRFKGNVVIGPGCRIGDNVTISDSVIWNDTNIGDNVIVKEAVIGEHCVVNAGACIAVGSVIASGTSVLTAIV
jgi:NDP-sugar pyrophosphorylase family protein